MSIEFRAFAVGPLGTNCYLVWDKETRKAGIIDPGGNKEQIASCVTDLGLDVEWVLLTHGHFDHVFYAGDLAREYEARIGMHAADVSQLTENLGIAEMFYDLSSYVDVTASDFLDDGAVVNLGSSQIQVRHTPGHSQGGLCFITDAGVFCGDTIFAGSIGRTDFPGGSHSQLIDSIKTQILTMPDDTLLYPGHGPSTTVGDERGSNPFLH